MNALSEEFDVEIWRDGFAWEMDYSKGDPISELRKMGPSKRKGTKIHFLPDKSIFTVTEYNADILATRLRQLAFLNKGIEINLTDDRVTDPKTGEPKTQQFKYTGGIAEFIKQLNKGKQVLHEKPIYMETTGRQRGDGDRAAVQRCVLGDGVFALRTTSTRWMAERIFRASARR